MSFNKFAILNEIKGQLNTLQAKENTINEKRAEEQKKNNTHKQQIVARLDIVQKEINTLTDQIDNFYMHELELDRQYERGQISKKTYEAEYAQDIKRIAALTAFEREYHMLNTEMNNLLRK